MNNTAIKSLCLALLLGGMATGCVPEEDPVIKVESVTIATGDLTLTEGEDVTLSAEVLPKDATDKTVKWSSSDERIVMVSSSGKMAAISVGVHHRHGRRVRATDRNGHASRCDQQERHLVQQ